MPRFRLVAPFSPQGDQGRCIESLARGIEQGRAAQVLLGVTGSGKTFTIANVVERLQRPTLVISHNKTLAAQLFNEFKGFFPDNAVEYFVSYYDYYQPEAYLPQTDTYIEKDSAINDDIDKLRHSATRSLLERRDVLIVASVSCIYGLGAPEYYARLRVPLAVGEEHGLRRLLRELVDIQYQRNDLDFHRGTFRVRGDVVEIFPTYEGDAALRVEFFGDQIERITRIDPLTGAVTGATEAVTIWPGSHYVVPKEEIDRSLAAIEAELAERLVWLRREEKLLEAQRLEQRTRFDLEMIREIGFCSGIENYSRHFTGRDAGSAAADAPRLLSAGLPARDRREPRHPAAAAGHGARGPLAQDESRGARLSPPLGVRQPAAEFRGVRAAGRAEHLHLRDAGAVRAGEGGGVRRRADRPADGPDGAGGRDPPGGRPGRGSPRRDPDPGREGRAGAGHRAHQAHGRGPHGALHRARAARALPALRRRDARAAAPAARSAARGASTR